MTITICTNLYELESQENGFFGFCFRALKRTKIQSIDEGLHVCKLHHDIKTNTNDKPKIAKAKRIDDERHGVKAQSRPIPGSKASGWKKSFSGEVTRR